MIPWYSLFLSCFWVTRAKFLIKSFLLLILEVPLHDILCLRLFATVHNHHTTSAIVLQGSFPFSCQFYRGLLVLPCGSDGKVSAYSAGDLGSIPGLGRSSGEGNGNPLQYSCLENPVDGGACWATVRGVSDFTSLHFTHSSGFLLSLSLMRLICHSSQGPSPTWDKLIRVRFKHNQMGSKHKKMSKALVASKSPMLGHPG